MGRDNIFGTYYYMLSTITCTILYRENIIYLWQTPTTNVIMHSLFYKNDIPTLQKNVHLTAVNNGIIKRSDEIFSIFYLS